MKRSFNLLSLSYDLITMKNYLLVVILFLSITNCSNNKEETIIGEWKSIDNPLYEISQSHLYIYASDSTYQLIIEGEDGEYPLPFSVVGDSIIFNRGDHYIPIVGRDNIYFKQKYYFQKENREVFLVIGDHKYKRLQYSFK